MSQEEVTDIKKLSLRERIGKTTAKDFIYRIEMMTVHCPPKENVRRYFEVFKELHFDKSLKIKITGETVDAICREFGPDIPKNSKESLLYKELEHLVNIGLTSIVFGPYYDKEGTFAFSTLATMGSLTGRYMTDRLRTLPDGLLYSDGMTSLLEKAVKLGYPVLDCDDIPFDIVYSSPIKSANKIGR